MQKLINILFNRNSLFIIAILAGFILPEGAKYLKPFVLPVLSVVMAFSLTGILFKEFFPLKNLVRPMLTGVFLSYIVSGVIILLAAWILSPAEEFYPGFVVIAAAPCGVGVIPFTFILKGDVKFSALGAIGSYFASFLLAPLYFTIFLSSVQMPYEELFKILLFLILIPFIISRLLLMNTLRNVVINIRGKIVNLGFGVVIFTVVGLNNGVFFHDSHILIPVLVISILATFGIGYLYYWISVKVLKKKDKGRVISNMLMVSIKNNGFAIAMAVVLFPPEAGIPPVIMGMSLVLYFLFLSYKFGDNSKPLPN